MTNRTDVNQPAMRNQADLNTSVFTSIQKLSATAAVKPQKKILPEIQSIGGKITEAAVHTPT